MSKYILVVHSNPCEGSDEEYNEWYNNVHLGEVLQVPGFVAAQRFKLSNEVDPIAGEVPEHKYLSIYELETDNPQSTIDALEDAVANGMTISHAIDTDNIAASLYGPISKRDT
jgi:hypothetical protein